MRILVLGSGGREHAIIWKLLQCPGVEKAYCAPGNGGIAREVPCFAADPTDAARVAQLASELKTDLIFVGPEAPLVAGLVDELTRQGFLVAGPTREAARLEGSKIFAKQFMQRHRIPTADFVTCEDLATARANIARWGGPVAIKADGLAAGKGVVVAADRAEAEQALDSILSGKLVGEAGKKIVLEQRLVGEEISFLVLTDGNTTLPLVPTQDHKPVFDDDRGPNTGGMGAYSDDGMVSSGLHRRIMDEIVYPTIEGLRAEGMLYRGILYCGLMITTAGPKVIEYNVRFGDPETQALLVRLETDLAELAADVARGTLRSGPLQWKPGASVCVVACSEGYPGKYPTGREIRGIEEAESGGARIFHAGTAASNGRLVTSGGRVLGITACGPDLASATRSAYEAASKIHFEGIHYRRDIARKGLWRTRPL
ncbi:MAG: phosphoribosylamine--glycine ligase [Acidobacteria bacterium]|nr:phosphoribosylamine--glycine ligase [Acidobacteriota bacterium]